MDHNDLLDRVRDNADSVADHPAAAVIRKLVAWLICSCVAVYAMNILQGVGGGLLQ